MLAEVAPKSKAAESVAALVQLLMGQEKPQKSAKFSLPFLEKLRKR